MIWSGSLEVDKLPPIEEANVTVLYRTPDGHTWVGSNSEEGRQRGWYLFLSAAQMDEADPIIEQLQADIEAGRETLAGATQAERNQDAWEKVARKLAVGEDGAGTGRYAYHVAECQMGDGEANKGEG